jgi:hypothetical protein
MVAFAGHVDNVYAAHMAGILGRLTGTGMMQQTAERWLDAWVLEATGRGLPEDGDYWQSGCDWIAAERAERRPGWTWNARAAEAPRVPSCLMGGDTRGPRCAGLRPDLNET